MKQKIATTLLSCCLLVPVAQAEDLPKYLQLARDFVANTKPENNAYTLGKSFTRMPGVYCRSGCGGRTGRGCPYYRFALDAAHAF